MPEPQDAAVARERLRALLRTAAWAVNLEADAALRDAARELARDYPGWGDEREAAERLRRLWESTWELEGC